MQGESAKGQDEHDEGNPVLLATRVGKNVAYEYTHFSLSLFLWTGGLPHLPGVPHLHAITGTKSKTIYVSYSPWSPGHFLREGRHLTFE